VRGIGLTRIVFFLLSTTCIASCQSGLLPLSEQSSLPNAPSPTKPQTSRAEECRLVGIKPLRIGNASFGADVTQAFAPTQLWLAKPPAPKVEGSTFLVRYLSPPSLQQDTTQHVSASNSVMGRTSFAVSRILITHDISGKARPNTTSLLQVLTSALAHTANHPSRTRTASATFDGFRSTISGDAGGQVFHEFKPDIMQVVKHLKFVSRIEQHVVAHGQPSAK
jgi:hypothetical protein